MNYAMSVEFIESTYRYGALSLAIAYAFLLVATLDLAVALLSMITISAIVVSNMGCMYLYGWELGIIEAICAQSWTCDRGRGVCISAPTFMRTYLSFTVADRSENYFSRIF